MKILLMIGAGLMALGVALGAFGAHALKERLAPNMLANWQTGVLYHMVHALGIIDGVGYEITQNISGTHLYEEFHAVRVSEGSDILHPAHGRFQMGHDDALNLHGVWRKGLLGGVGYDGNLGSLEIDSRDEFLQFVVNTRHDRGMERHAYPELRSSVALFLEFLTQSGCCISISAYDHLER